MKYTAVLLTMALAAKMAFAGTYYISADLGDDANDGTTMATAWKSLSKAFGNSGEVTTSQPAYNSTVVLSNGTYKLSWTLKPKNTIIKGCTGNPNDVIIDGQNAVQCVSMGVYGGHSVVADVTLANGAAGGPFINTSFYGGAGAFLGYWDTMVTNCVVRDCASELDMTFQMGGGIMVHQGKVYDTRVENCHIKSGGSRGYGGGIGIYGKDAYVIRCAVTNCSIVTTSGDNYGGGIGEYYEVTQGGTVSACEVIDCAVTNSTGSTAGHGGGISINQGGKIKDTLVRNCFGGYGQINIVNKGQSSTTLISGCTIDGGVRRAIYSEAPKLTVEKTLIENIAVDVSSSYEGFALSFSGDGNKMLSSVVRNCSGLGKAKNPVRFVNGSSSVVSNCVIQGCTTAMDDYSGAIYGSNCNGLQIVDTIICSNKAYRATDVYSASGTGAGFTIRNCFFNGNQCRNACHIYLTEDRQNYIDHCTFVRESGDAIFRATGFTTAWASKCKVVGCVFAGNSASAFDYPDGVQYPIYYCNVNIGGNTRTSPVAIEPSSNIASGMKYVNSANLDYRQAKGSKGIDIDTSSILSTDWTQDKHRMDLGDGTYTLMPLGKHGIEIVHNNASRRLSGSYPDIGCFEYLHPTGATVVLFR